MTLSRFDEYGVCDFKRGGRATYTKGMRFVSLAENMFRVRTVKKKNLWNLTLKRGLFLRLYSRNGLIKYVIHISFSFDIKHVNS